MTTLASLALLKTRFDIEKTDFLDSLRPFIAYVIVKDKLTSFAALEIQGKMLEQFGLNLPRHTVDLVLRRMTKAGQLKRASNNYDLLQIEFDVGDFERNRAEATQHQNATEAGLVQYSKDVLNLTLTKDDVENALNEYIDQIFNRVYFGVFTWINSSCSRQIN